MRRNGEDRALLTVIIRQTRDSDAAGGFGTCAVSRLGARCQSKTHRLSTPLPSGHSTLWWMLTSVRTGALELRHAAP